MAVGSLLLLCVAMFWPWDSQSKPIDFVCNKPARETLNIISRIESELLHCEGLATLPNAVQLPCTALHVASWENKSLQQKRGDLVASLRQLHEGVEAVSALSQLPCATSLLQSLLQNINNYLSILTHLHFSEAEESPVLSCVPRSSHSMSVLLLSYNRLLSGKLERFMDNLHDRCTTAQ